MTTTLKAMLDGRPALLVVEAEELRAALGIRREVKLPELAAALGRSQSTLKEMWRRREIPGRKIGGRVTFDVDQVRRALPMRNAERGMRKGSV